MKIIALLPVKNETWILPTYLSSMKKIADEIIALDDGSTDASAALLEKAGVIIIKDGSSAKVNMSEKRRLLLKKGRERMGTHFIWLDADESFNTDFLNNGRDIICTLLPGQKIGLRWITLWKSMHEERIDGVWRENYKDVIVYDTPDYTFEDKDLSEARSQGPNKDNVVLLPESRGVILHFQFSNFKRAEIKQAWYRCVERVQSKRSARRINHLYSITRDGADVLTRPVPAAWFSEIEIPSPETTAPNWYLESLWSMFAEYGITFFEPLDIWNIPELHEKFRKEIGREPRVKTYPAFILSLYKFKKKLL